MNDGWEYRHMDAGFDPAVDNATDANPDNDGMTNGSGDGYPDYDYELDCATNALPPNVVVQDPDGLFGTDETSTTFGGVRLDGIFDRRDDCADSAEGRRFNPSAEARSINRHALSRKRQVLHWKLARADAKKVY